MSDLPHCKSPSHLEVVDSGGTGGLGVDAMVATYVPDCLCHQEPGRLQPVIIVASVRHPDRGLHLLPEAWPYVAGNLRAVSDAVAPRSVDLRHTVRAQWQLWATFTKAGAHDLANRISIAAVEARL